LPVGVVRAEIFHFRLNRNRIYEQNVGISNGQAQRISANEWANLEAPGRKKYKDMQAEDKKRHFKELEAYNTKLALKQSTALATSDGFEELLTIRTPQRANLDAEGRKQYKDTQAEDKKRHNKELEAYHTKLLSTSSINQLFTSVDDKPPLSLISGLIKSHPSQRKSKRPKSRKSQKAKEIKINKNK
jgi:hypothetical protein